LFIHATKPTLTEKIKDKIDEIFFMITILERVPSKFKKQG